VELVAKTHVCSVVGAQRLVFFRFLIDIIAAERSRLSSRSTESLPPALPQQARSKRKSVAAKGARSSSSTRIPAEDPAPDGAKSVEAEATASLRAAHGSLPSPEEAAGNETSDDGHPFQEADPVGDECEKPASRLQQQLESAITQLRRALPTIDADADLDAEIYALNPAIRATYLAAVACHESVLLMVRAYAAHVLVSGCLVSLVCCRCESSVRIISTLTLQWQTSYDISSRRCKRSKPAIKC